MDDQEKFLRKQGNIYRLHELVDRTVLSLPPNTQFELSEAMIKRMHNVAMTGLLPIPGEYRQAEVHIRNSAHKCPSWIDVPALMGTLCLYLTSNWSGANLVHLSAFTLWRLNWIHPFQNGNGRTARAASYLVLCARHGQLFPPKNSIIEQIQRNKQPYYELLRGADVVFEQTNNIPLAISNLESYLSNLLAEQLRANF